MFFIGAPLGAIIRKGGLGLPIVFAILIFIIFHFINTFGKKVAQQDEITPFLGSWMSSFVLTPFAILLTTRATNDKGISINFDWLINIYKRIFPEKTEEQLTEQPVINIEQVAVNQDEEWETLNGYDNDVLIKIVKNAKQFGYTQEYRTKVLKVLASRGISQEELLLNNNLYNTDYNKIEELSRLYKIYSRIALVTYVIGLALSSFGKPSTLIEIILEIAIALVFYTTVYKSQSLLDEMGTIMGKKIDLNLYLVLFAGFPFFILFYFYNRSYLKEVLSGFNKNV
jgi:lipopolysaccharide export system permease protein